MSDLIDRKEAVEAVKNEMLSWLDGNSNDYRDVVDAIMDLLTVDALPVIRCRDCKFRYTDGENVTANYCKLNHNRVMADDWFCADAERKEE